MPYTYVYKYIVEILFHCIYSYCYAPYQVLKRANIRGPTPDFLLGNYREIHAKVSVCLLVSNLNE